MSMQPTNSFRWYAELIQMPLRLQQLWSDTYFKTEWRDVPTVVGK